MNLKKILSSAVAAAVIGPLSVMAQEKKTDAKQTEPAKTEPAKAKAEKVSGDIGLLDTEKNYMIVVTKDGKLVTLDIN
jgi:hypothetical protein